MATYQGLSTLGLNYVGGSAVGEAIAVLYDRAPLGEQQNRLKGYLLAYQRPSWVPPELSGIYVGHVALYYGASSLYPRFLAPDLPTFFYINWKVDGILWKLDTGYGV